jgi:hypothetical protein
MLQNFVVSFFEIGMSFDVCGGKQWGKSFDGCAGCIASSWGWASAWICRSGSARSSNSNLVSCASGDPWQKQRTVALPNDVSTSIRSCKRGRNPVQSLYLTTVQHYSMNEHVATKARVVETSPLQPYYDCGAIWGAPGKKNKFLSITWM